MWGDVDLKLHPLAKHSLIHPLSFIDLQNYYLILLFMSLLLYFFGIRDINFPALLEKIISYINLHQTAHQILYIPHF